MFPKTLVTYAVPGNETKVRKCHGTTAHPYRLVHVALNRWRWHHENALNYKNPEIYLNSYPKNKYFITMAHL